MEGALGSHLGKSIGLLFRWLYLTENLTSCLWLAYALDARGCLLHLLGMSLRWSPVS